jgi:hypothetical protein
MVDASKNIDNQIAELKDWRGPVMSRLRKLIHEADPDIVEEWKWSTGIYSYDGMVCALGPFSDHVKVNFFSGASLKDPSTKLFNAGLDSKKTRAVDIHEGDKLNEASLKSLIKTAVAYNKSKK